MFPPLDVRNMAPVDVQIDGHVRLSPSLPLPQCADTFPNRHRQRVVFAGHVLMVALCCGHLCLAYQTGQIRQRAGEREVLTVLELGDWVRIPPDGEVRKIVAFGPGEFVTTQLGNDASTVKPIKISDLELVAKATKPGEGEGFVPPHSIME